MPARQALPTGPTGSPPGLCIVMPVLDEAERLHAALRALQPLRQRGVQLVVVDGGSRDHTLQIARQHADLALQAPRGRASQMNAGAAACTAPGLLFLHADTRLPEHADTLVQQALQDGAAWGRFDVHIDSPRLLLRVVSAAMNLRSRLSGIATGDQAIFVQRAAFTAAGGYPDIALMEDIALSQRLGQLGRPACLRPRVITSARRWERHGAWRTIVLMWRLRAAYRLGADPDRLAERYGYAPRRR